MYALDEHRVLRRYRTRPVPEDEVLVMRHARAHGYPVPEIFDVDGRDMVLERIDGPTMQEVLEADVSRFEREVRTLAALHERLHAITAPPGLDAIADGEALLHLDLHPKNVIHSPSGPVVIDWANARRGHWADDVAQTIAVVWSALGDPEMRGREAIVHHFVERFVAAFDREVVRAHITAAVARRVADPNVSAAEREAVAAQRL